MLKDIFTSTLPIASGPKHLTNTPKTNKSFALQAIKASGLAVEWRDSPNDQMPASMAADYGSIWSLNPRQDCSAFWREFDRLRAASITAGQESKS